MDERHKEKQKRPERRDHGRVLGVRELGKAKDEVMDTEGDFARGAAAGVREGEARIVWNLGESWGEIPVSACAAF